MICDRQDKAVNICKNNELQAHKGIGESPMALLFGVKYRVDKRE